MGVERVERQEGEGESIERGRAGWGKVVVRGGVGRVCDLGVLNFI